MEKNKKENQYYTIFGMEDNLTDGVNCLGFDKFHEAVKYLNDHKGYFESEDYRSDAVMYIKEVLKESAIDYVVNVAGYDENVALRLISVKRAILRDDRDKGLKNSPIYKFSVCVGLNLTYAEMTELAERLNKFIKIFSNDVSFAMFYEPGVMSAYLDIKPRIAAYPFPDEGMTFKDLNDFGYDWNGIVPMGYKAKEFMWELLNSDNRIAGETLKIYPDGTESYFAGGDQSKIDRASFEQHYDCGGIFGVGIKEWQKYVDRCIATDKTPKLFRTQPPKEEKNANRAMPQSPKIR